MSYLGKAPVGGITEVTEGGTGADNVIDARTNLGISATNTPFTPTGNIAATNVQTAIAEVDSEKLASSTYTAADVLAKLITVDGASSGLDADKLDGQEGSYYATSSHNHTGVYEPADADIAKLDVLQTWTAQQIPKNGTLTDGATIDWNGNSNGQVVTLTLGGNRTMNAPTNIQQFASYIMRIAQDGTGSRTLTWNAAYKFGGSAAPVLTTTASKVDIITFIGGSSNTLECTGYRLDAV